MKDWAADIETRNYSVRRHIDRRHLSDLLQITASVAMLAGVFGWYAWVRCNAVDIGYDEQALAKQESSMLTEQRYLILEEENLKNPGRIESIVQAELGMVRVRTSQLVFPLVSAPDTAGLTALAMAAVPSSPPEVRKPAAND